MQNQLRLDPVPSVFRHSSSKKVFRRQSLSTSAVAYFEEVLQADSSLKKMSTYYAQTVEYLKKVIPEGQRVLIVGGLTAHLLEELRPSYGVGLDVNRKYISRVKELSPHSKIAYFSGLPEEYSTHPAFTKFPFDTILVLNFIDHSQDISVLVESLRPFTGKDTRIVFSMLNPLWHSLVRAASRLKIRIPDYERNLIDSRTLRISLEAKNFRVTDITRRVLVPRNLLGLAGLCNRWLAKLPLLNSLCFMQYVTAEPLPHTQELLPSCSVLIPCFNEEGNIEECIDRVPEMGSFTEIVVINDGSKDKTASIVESLLPHYSNLKLISYSPNQGKGNAVLRGIREAKGDIVMILDADMTVPPEELVDFYEVLATKTASFVSGNRFLYPMEKKAMRFANYLGNILFSWLVRLIVGSAYSDTLCGTKAMYRKDFKDFKIEDKAWGDFDFIFYASKLKLKSVQIPVHYLSRVQGESKMKAFSAGFKFLHLCLRKWIELP